jgi:hypothetical protein
MSVTLKKPFDDLVPTHSAKTGEWYLAYEILDDKGNKVSRSYYQGPDIVNLIRQLASAHAEASLALHRCRKREAKLKASSK